MTAHELNCLGNPQQTSEFGRRIVVTGGRDFQDTAFISQVFDAIALSSADTIVHGGSRGLDELATAEARRRKVPTERHQAEWRLYGRAAGPIRNREMLTSGVDLLLAFPGGRGTHNCVTQARELGVPVYVTTDLAATRDQTAQAR